MTQHNRSLIRAFLRCALAGRSRRVSLAFGASCVAQAQQLGIDIVNGNASAIPIAVVPFGFEGGGLPPETDVGEVVRADLARSGQFRTLPKTDIVELPTREADVKFATWRLLKQDYLVVGHATDAGDGAVRVEFELFDVAKQQRMAGLAISGQRTALRDVAHQIADIIYEKILGVRGAFWTRIAYITATGLVAEHPVRADGRRFGRLQSAGHRALARTAAVAGMVAGRQASSPTTRSRAAIRRSSSRISPPVRASRCRAARASTARRRSRRTADASR